MDEIETKIINKIQQLKSLSQNDARLADDIEADLKSLIHDERHFGQLSKAFINDQDLIHFVNQSMWFEKNYFFLRFKIEDYLLAINTNETSSTDALHRVEEALKTYLEAEHYSLERKKSGTAMMPLELRKYPLIRHVFSTENKALTDIFLKYLPMPPQELFDGYRVPEMISKKKQDSTAAINAVLLKHERQPILLNHTTVKMQRAARAKLRQKEESQRVYQRHHRGMTQEKTDAMLKNANTPYAPQCDASQFPGLAERIMDAAKKVTLFKTVKHLTAPANIVNILNGGLYGQRKLLESYLPFKPAALASFDIEQGDGNVVCLGANLIDSRGNNNIQLTFDVDKIIQSNPNAFYKQRDLGYNYEEKRHIKIGALELIFSHTTRTGMSQPEHTSPFILYEDDRGPRVKAIAYVWADLLIAYDLKRMHEILTLNFFRFIDALFMPWDNSSYAGINEIYSALNQLSEEELVTTLQDIGKKITDTMEFNFYGAHQIDFATLLNISTGYYTLELPSFIEALNNGQIDKLDEAKKHLPEVFESWRFIEYLCANIKDAEMIERLQNPSSSAPRP